MAAALALALILGGESVLALSIPLHQGRHDVDRLLFVEATEGVNRSAIVLGDSVTQGALRGTPAFAETADYCTNMSLGIPGNVCLLRRVLAEGPGLRTAVLVFIPETYEYAMDTEGAATYFQSCFLRNEEVRALFAVTGVDRAFLRVLRNSFLRPPSMMRRGALPLFIPFFARFRIPDPPEVEPHPPGLIRKLVEERRRTPGFRASAIAEVYLSELLDQARDRGVRVVLATAPIPLEILRTWRDSGRLDEYRRFLEKACVGRPNVHVVPPEEFSRFPLADFRDHAHLDSRHTVEYGTMLSRIILECIRGDRR